MRPSWLRTSLDDRPPLLLAGHVVFEEYGTDLLGRDPAFLGQDVGQVDRGSLRREQLAPPPRPSPGRLR